VSIAVKLLLAAGAAALAVSALSKLVATRSRNARPTAIRYTAPSHLRGPALTVGQLSISPATTKWQSVWAEPSPMES